jgi:hypothetical protein
MSYRYRLCAFVLIALVGGGLLQRTAASAQSQCAFTLGFAALRDQIPAIVGDCLEDEHFNLENGNAEQRTTGGLLVWRKADNWTAFTDGITTWINGPEGLASRPNSGPLFAWESPAPEPAAPAQQVIVVIVQPTLGPAPTATPSGPDPALLARCYTTAAEIAAYTVRIGMSADWASRFAKELEAVCRQAVIDHGEAGYACFEQVHWLGVRNASSGETVRNLFRECLSRSRS